MLRLIDNILDQKHHRFIHRNLFPWWKRWWFWIDWKAENGGFACQILLGYVATICLMCLGALSIFAFFLFCVDLVSGEDLWQLVLSDILLLKG